MFRFISKLHLNSDGLGPIWCRWYSHLLLFGLMEWLIVHIHNYCWWWIMVIPLLGWWVLSCSCYFVHVCMQNRVLRSSFVSHHTYFATNALWCCIGMIYPAIQLVMRAKYWILSLPLLTCCGTREWTDMDRLVLCLYMVDCTILHHLSASVWFVCWFLVCVLDGYVYFFSFF